MIDPLETVVAFLRAQTTLQTLTSDRIAPKHKFGGEWSVGQAAITVRQDGGNADAYVSHQALQYEVRCYAGSQIAAMELWRALIALSRVTSRVAVVTTQGTALLYRFQPVGGPSCLYDSQIGSDMVLVLFEADVAENSIQ